SSAGQPTSGGLRRLISTGCWPCVPQASTRTGPTRSCRCWRCVLRPAKRLPGPWNSPFQEAPPSISMWNASKSGSAISVLPGKRRPSRGTAHERQQMTLRLSTADADFEARFAAFLSTKREASQEVDAAVREIVARVREEGDKAVAEYVKRFDGFDIAQAGMRVARSEIDAAYEATDDETLSALKLAKKR